MTRPTSPCVVCQRADAIPECGYVCEPCRASLPGLLDDIEDLWMDLDPTPPAGSGQRVSGSREAPLPLSVDPLDLGMPAHITGVSEAANLVPATIAIDVKGRHDYVRLVDGEPVYVSDEVRATVRVGLRGPDRQPLYTTARDQIGYPSVATVLGSWVRDWHETRAMGESVPVPTVPVLARWLRDRLDWACDRHPAVDDFVAQLRALRQALRVACRDFPPRPEHCQGVPCKRCDLLSLYRATDGSGRVECTTADCGAILTATEYEDWTRLLAEWAKRRVA